MESVFFHYRENSTDFLHIGLYIAKTEIEWFEIKRDINVSLKTGVYPTFHQRMSLKATSQEAVTWCLMAEMLFLLHF